MTKAARARNRRTSIPRTKGRKPRKFSFSERLILWVRLLHAYFADYFDIPLTNKNIEDYIKSQNATTALQHTSDLNANADGSFEGLRPFDAYPRTESLGLGPAMPLVPAWKSFDPSIYQTKVFNDHFFVPSSGHTTSLLGIPQTDVFGLCAFHTLEGVQQFRISPSTGPDRYKFRFSSEEPSKWADSKILSVGSAENRFQFTSMQLPKRPDYRFSPVKSTGEELRHHAEHPFKWSDFASEIGKPDVGIYEPNELKSYHIVGSKKDRFIDVAMPFGDRFRAQEGFEKLGSGLFMPSTRSYGGDPVLSSFLVEPGGAIGNFFSSKDYSEYVQGLVEKRAIHTSKSIITGVRLLLDETPTALERHTLVWGSSDRAENERIRAVVQEVVRTELINRTDEILVTLRSEMGAWQRDFKIVDSMDKLSDDLLDLIPGVVGRSIKFGKHLWAHVKARALDRPSPRM